MDGWMDNKSLIKNKKDANDNNKIILPVYKIK